MPKPALEVLEGLIGGDPGVGGVSRRLVRKIFPKTNYLQTFSSLLITTFHRMVKVFFSFYFCVNCKHVQAVRVTAERPAPLKVGGATNQEVLRGGGDVRSC